MKFMLTRLRFRCKMFNTNVSEVNSIIKVNMFLHTNYSFFFFFTISELGTESDFMRSILLQ